MGNYNVLCCEVEDDVAFRIFPAIGIGPGWKHCVSIGNKFCVVIFEWDGSHNTVARHVPDMVHWDAIEKTSIGNVSFFGKCMRFRVYHSDIILSGGENSSL